MELSNDTKIQAGNFLHAMQAHLGCCSRCSEYLYDGDGDMCDDGKQIIVREFAYADTAPQFPPNS